MVLGFEPRVAGSGTLVLDLCDTAIRLRVSQPLLTEERSHVQA